ncbi:hypothetical protein, partial [Parabacteroides goldsteinii]|uniref:hypothetical protein n=1 Tax=Parabacteroides goldsteinii TaxID=328812 RepID=UPI0025AEA425
CDTQKGFEEKNKGKQANSTASLVITNNRKGDRTLRYTSLQAIDPFSYLLGSITASFVIFIPILIV